MCRRLSCRTSVRPSSELPCRILSSTKENGSFGSRETSQSDSLHISTAMRVDVGAVEAAGDDLADRVRSAARAASPWRRPRGAMPRRAGRRGSGRRRPGTRRSRRRCRRPSGRGSGPRTPAPSRPVGGLVRAGVVDERFQGVLHDLLGERLAACSARRRLRGTASRRPAGRRAARPCGRSRRSRRMIPMNGRSRFAQLVVARCTARSARSASSTWSLGLGWPWRARPWSAAWRRAGRP